MNGRQRRGALYVVCLLLVALVAVLTACGSSGAPAGEQQPKQPAQTPTESGGEKGESSAGEGAGDSAAIDLPDLISWSAYDVGSTGYAQSSAVADVLKRELGVSLRVIPAGTDVSRMSALRSGRVEFSATGVASYFASDGIYDFATEDWGPQPLRLVWMTVSDSGVTLNTTKESGIDTPADLRGKRVAYVPGAPALNVQAEAVLAFANLTWDDVEQVVFPNYGASVQGLIDGSVDAAWGFMDVPTLEGLAASPRGYWVVRLPHDDTEGWSRLQELAPWLQPHLATRAAGQIATKDNPLEVAIYPYPVLVTYADQDEELVYNMTKALHTLYPEYEKVLPAMWGWRLENRVPFPVPYHDGTVRYLKEIGNWTEEDEQRQQKLLERQQTLIQAFEEAVAAAADQGVSAQEFPEFWMQRRNEVLQALD